MSLAILLAFVPSLQAGDPPCTSNWLTGYGAPGLWVSPQAPPNGDVIATVDLGAGPELWVGGSFLAGAAIGGGWGLLRRTALGWDSVGGGTNALVLALHAADIGDGPRMFISGTFVTVGGVAARRIAQWDGTTWAPLGGGLDSGGRAIAAFDDGTGPALFVAGNVAATGGAPAQWIARWDGQGWSALPGGLDSYLNALIVHDDGTGPALYLAGAFKSAGGMPTAGLARWNGQSWSAHDATQTSLQPSAFTVHDFGAGPRLVASRGGWVNDAPRIVVWDGSSWEPVTSTPPLYPRGLASVDDGTGPRLWVGDGAGLHSYANGVWSSHPSNHAVNGLAVQGPPGEQLLTATGYFGSIEGITSPLLAARGPCAQHAPIEVDGCTTPWARLGAHAPRAKLGHGFPIGVTTPQVSGNTLLLVSDRLVPGVEEGGCGVPIADWGHLLLGGAITQLLTVPAAPSHAGAYSGGLTAVTLPIPAAPGLGGVRIYLQALTFNVNSGSARLSNALSVRLLP